MTRTRARHGAATVTTALVATLVAGVLPFTAAPAGASPGCTDETRPTIEIIPGVPIPAGDGCDDDTPPDTVLSASTPPDAHGFVSASAMTFSFRAQVSDGDAGPFGLECRLSGPGQAHDWRACTSPATYAGLPDGAYTFSARAVDLGDSARNPDDGMAPTVADAPDLDPSPASTTWSQDTKAPFVFVTQSGYDEETPTQPVITSSTVPIRLNSNEPGSTFECTDNGAPVTCSPGRWELVGAKPGRHVFSARTLDRAGNASAWSDPIEFFVPADLARKRGWKKVTATGYFRGDAVRATRRGARLVLPRAKVGELRLLAPSGPRMGKVRIRVGRRDWHVVDLRGAKSTLRQYTVLDRYSGMRSGRITIETLGNKPVVIDAVVARPNRFPPAQ